MKVIAMCKCEVMKNWKVYLSNVLLYVKILPMAVRREHVPGGTGIGSTGENPVRRLNVGKQLADAIELFKSGGLELDAEPVRRRVISLTDRVVPRLTSNIVGLAETVTRSEVRRGREFVPLTPDELENRQRELDALREKSADARMLRRVAKRIDNGLHDNRIS